MKLQKLIMLTIAVFAFTFMGYGQVEPGEAPMFGNVRGVKPMAHDFGKISETSKSYSFKLENTGKKVIDIVDIKIPAKIAINVLGFHIKPGEAGTIIVTVDPSIMDEGKFYTWFILTTEEKELDQITTKKIKFTIQGEVM